VIKPSILTLVEIEWNIDAIEEFNTYDPTHPIDPARLRMPRHFCVSGKSYSIFNQVWLGCAIAIEPTDMNSSDSFGNLQISYPELKYASPCAYDGEISLSRHNVKIMQYDLTNSVILRTLKTYASKVQSTSLDGVGVLSMELKLHSTLSKDAILGVNSFWNASGMHQ
jgi:hypothetical protein